MSLVRKEVSHSIFFLALTVESIPKFTGCTHQNGPDTNPLIQFNIREIKTYVEDYGCKQITINITVGNQTNNYNQSK